MDEIKNTNISVIAKIVNAAAKEVILLAHKILIVFNLWVKRAQVVCVWVKTEKNFVQTTPAKVSRIVLNMDL